MLSKALLGLSVPDKQPSMTAHYKVAFEHVNRYPNPKVAFEHANRYPNLKVAFGHAYPLLVICTGDLFGRLAPTPDPVYS